MFGPAPTGYASGYMSSNGIVAVSLLNCPTNTHPNRFFTACLANAGYYIASSGVQFPPSPFMSGLSFTAGTGETFTASASSSYSAEEASFVAFSSSETSAASPNNRWTIANSGGTMYVGTAYTGAYSSTVDGQAVKGEWLQLQASNQHVLGAFSIQAGYSSPSRAPGSFILAGSNDGVTWSSLQEVSGSTSWASKQVKTFSVTQSLSFYYFRLIVTNTSGSEIWLSVDKLRFYDAQLSTCTGTCSAGITKFCSPDGASSYCCTPSQYFIQGVSTACTNCPANSMADLVYQERCVANAGFLAPSLYMFDGSSPTYQNLGSKTSHVVTPVGWRPTFASPGTRTGAYFDSSVNGNYYKVVNDYNTVTLAFWMYTNSAYVSGVLSELVGLWTGSTIGMQFVLGPDNAIPGLYVVYGTTGGSAFTTAAQFPVSTWLHVALVIPSGTDRLQRVYVNGAKVATRSNGLGATQDLLSYQTLMLGAGSTRYFKGYLQQLTMYNYAMSDAEVTTLYNSGTPLVYVPCPGTCTTGLIRHCLPTGVAVCCPPGTFFRAELDSACQVCPAGTYSLTSGSSCTLCPAGTFRQNTSQIAGTPTFSSNGVHPSCFLSNSGLDAIDGWCAATASVNLYYLVTDAGAARLIDSVTTQGRAGADQWVTSYDLSYSLDSTTWTVFAYNLVGNTDRNTKKSYQLNVVARYLKFLPQGYTNHPSMRVGFSARTSTLAATSCQSCPANTASFQNRTGCAANAGYYNVDASLLAYYPFRPENVYADASLNGYTLTDTNGVLYKPQSEFNTGPFAGAGVAFFNNPGVSYAGVTINRAIGAGAQSFMAMYGANINLLPLIGSDTSPGPGFTWCFWTREADGATPGVVNTIAYPLTGGFYKDFTSNPVSDMMYIGSSMGGCNVFSNSAFRGGVYPPNEVKSRVWSHICTMVQGRDMKVYFNCASSSCTPTTSRLNSDLPSMSVFTLLGQGPYSTAYYGWISDFRIYRKVLTAPEVFAVRSYSGATAFSVNGDPALLAYYPFKSGNIYADASGNGYTLADTNAGRSPVSDTTTAPFPGAGVVYMDNNNIAATAGTAKTFRIQVGSGLDLRSMIGSAAVPAAGFSVCFWYRAQDGPTAGTVNAIDSVSGFSFTNAAADTNSIRWTRSTTSTSQFWVLVAANVGLGNDIGTGMFSRWWTHVCFVHQDRTVKAYYNCTSSSCAGRATVTLLNDVANIMYTDVFIGQHLYYTAWYGWFSEVRLYRKALAPGEVYAVRSYTGSSQQPVVAPPAQALLAYYPFSSSASLYTDASGNGYTLADANTAGGYSPSYGGGTGTTSPYPGLGSAYFANSAGNDVTTATGSLIQGFRVSVGTGWSLYSTIGTAASPGPGFTWCYWLRGADGATPGTLNTIGYPFVFTIGNQFTIVNAAGFYGFYDGRNSGSAQGGSGTNYWFNTAASGLGVDGVYTRNWVHMCYTWQGKTFKAYRDCGSSTCTATASATLGNEAYNGLYTQVLIGQGTYGKGWYGWLSEFRFYKKALTPAEVFAIKSYDGTSQTAVNSVNSGLLAYYPFHPNAFLVDASGVTGSLSPTGSPASIPGSMTDLQNVAYMAQASGLAKTSATPQFFTIPSITIGVYFSICLWYNPDVLSGNGPRLIELNTGVVGDSNIMLRRSSVDGNNLVVEMRNGATFLHDFTVNYPQTFKTGVWQHVCLTVAGIYGKLYYNSILRETDMASTQFTLTAFKTTTTYSSSFLGNTPYTFDLYRGQLDEVRIYGRAITQAEVTSIYNFRGDTATPGIILPCPATSCSTGSSGSCSTDGTTQCTACAAGSYSGTLGLTTCTTCPAGTFYATTGASACTACSAGTYSGTTGASQSSTCTACSIGSYTGKTGVSACTPCPANTWSSAAGARTCSANVGFYNLDDSLKAYYPFNPDAFLADVTGITGALTASASSPTSQASGPWASSYSAFLTGSASTVAANNQYFTLPAFTLPNDVTICSWFWISSSITRNWNRIWDFGVGAGNSNVLGAIYFNTNNLGFDVYRGGANIGHRSLTNGAQTVNTWRHVCMALSGTSQVVWLDGTSTAYTMSNSRDVTVQLTTNYIGRSNWGDLFWYGAFDDFRIYTKALTSLEISALYAFQGDTYSPMIILACPTPCAAGTYGGCTSVGAQACTACSGGTFSTGTGMLTVAACSQCVAGTYAAASSSACTACPAGTYSAVAGASLSSTCTACSAGTYSGTSGASLSSACTACPAGKFSSTTGASLSSACSACTATPACTAGTTARCSPDGVTRVCCGLNQFFREGVDTACQTCPVASFSADGSGTVCKTCSTNPIRFTTVYGGEVDAPITATYDIPNYKVYVFDTVGMSFLRYNQAFTLDVLAVGGGAGGSGKYSGGGGAGSVVFVPGALFRAPYSFVQYFAVNVGVGGSKYNQVPYTYGWPSYFQEIASATGGGAPGSWPDNSLYYIAGSGGGGGACSRTNCASQFSGQVGTTNQVGGLSNEIGGTGSDLGPGTTGNSRFVFANNGGLGSWMNSGTEAVNNGLHGGGGGGAGAAGGNEVAWTASCASGNQAACGRCGYGGDGVAGVTIDGVFYNFSTFFGKAFTDKAVNGYIAGGGGGGGYSSYGVIKCKGGLGGGGAGYKSTSISNKGEDGAPNTGSGGGGANDVLDSGGNGGSGLVLARIPTVCVCPAGTYSSTNGCGNCPTGTYWTGTGALSSGGCAACAAGTYSSSAGVSSAAACTTCAAGTFGFVAGMSACLSCSVGTYFGSSSCVQCSAGTYSVTAGASSSGACTACSAGTYSGTSGASLASVCTPCSAGTYSVTAGASLAATCTPCGAGTYSGTAGASLAGACTACIAGTYSGTSGASMSSVCGACFAGTYSTVVGAGSIATCTQCAAGTYSGTTGASLAGTCTACSAGTYSATAGASLASVCTPCSAGTYSISAGASSLAACVACSAGTYSLTAGASLASTCTACSTGAYSSATGASLASTCASCTAGSFSSNTGASVCAACPSNSWSASAARTCTANLGYYNLDDNLKAYYPFNPDSFRTDVTGITGSLTASASSPTSQASGPFGASSYSAYLSKTGPQFFTLPSLTLPNDMSICSWFYISTGIDRTFNRVWDFGIGTNDNILCGIYPSSNNLIAVVKKAATDQGTQTIVNGALGTEVWKHICLTITGTTANLWYNSGSNGFTLSSARNFNSLLTTNYIGKSNWADGPWHGAMDDFRIYTKALTSTEVAALYAFRGDTYSPMIMLACPTPCAAGTYGGCNAQSVATCTACSAGTFSSGTGMLTIAACGQCSAGTYAGTSASACTPCSAGTYSTGTGFQTSASCTACVAGTYSTGLGAISAITCQTCFAGTYFTGTGLQASASCTRCGAGTYSTALGAISQLTCQNCFAGTYFTGTGLQASAGCTACGAGTYSTVLGSISALACQNCFAGTYFTGTGLQAGASCTACGAGTYSTTLGATSSPACQNCFAGTYFTGTGLQASASCTACGAGTYSTTVGAILQLTCQNCFAGTYFTGTGLQASASCTACGAGTYSTALGAISSAACQNCLAGTYLTGAGSQTSANCTRCGAGTYSTALGAISSLTCQNCVAGTYQTGAGMQTSAACTACAAGLFSTALAAPTSQTCQPCVVGTFSTGLAMQTSAACIQCQAGSYGLTEGASSSLACKPCQAGTYLTASGAIPTFTSSYVLQRSTLSFFSNQPVGAYYLRINETSRVAVTQGVWVTFSSLPYGAQAVPLQIYSDIPYATADLVYYTDLGFMNYNLQLFDIVLVTKSSPGTFFYDGVSSNGSSSFVWDTRNVPSGLYLIKTSLASREASVSVFVASITPTTITSSPVLDNYGAYTIGACLGDTLVINRPTGASKWNPPYKDLYIYRYSMNDLGDFPALTLMASGSSPLTWTVSGIDDSVQCIVSYGAIAVTDTVFAGVATKIYALILLYPRPTLSNSSTSLIQPCQSCSAGTYSTGTGMQASATCLGCGAGLFSTALGAGTSQTCQACAMGTFSTSLAMPTSLTCTQCQVGSYSSVTGASSSQQACQPCQAGTYLTASGATPAITYTIRNPSYILERSLVSFWQTVNGKFYLRINGTSRVAVTQGAQVRFQSLPYDTQPVPLQVYSSIPNAWANRVFFYDLDIMGYNLQMFDIVLVQDIMAGIPYYVGVSSNGSSAFIWDTRNVPSGLYLIKTTLTNNEAAVSVFVASFTPVTITSSPVLSALSSSGAYTVAACLGDTLVLHRPTGDISYTGTPYKNIYITCFPMNDPSESPPLTEITSGPSPLTWTVAGIDDTVQCGVSYGPVTGMTFSDAIPFYAHILLYPRPLVSDGDVSIVQPCQSCSAGTYETGTGMPAPASCDLCSAGTFSTASGAVSAGTCTACIAGTYSPTAGATQVGTCIACPTGTYSGTAGQDALQDCTLCPTGTYSVATGATVSSTCSACQVGTYGAIAGASACTSCPVGKFLNTTGNSLPEDCLSCEAGSYMKDPGASVCTSCSAGTFSTALGADSLTTCTSCSSGSYSDAARSSACTTCPANSDVLSPGASQRGACTCNAGFAANLSIQSSQCQPCPSNSYCQGLSQLACPLHTHSPALSSLQAHCRCDAGYRCTYRRDARLTITFNAMSELNFASQADTIRAKLAVAADVPVANVTVLSYKSVVFIQPMPGPPTADM